MPPYLKDSPLKDIFIRKMVGSALFAEIAVRANGIWSAAELEDCLDSSRYEGYTGLYRKMAQGTIPENRTCKRIQRELGGGNLFWWRDSPYWQLIRLTAPKPAHIDMSLGVIKERRLQSRIWLYPPYENNEKNTFRSNRGDISMATVKAISAYHNFKALIILTAWARESRTNNIYKTDYQCAFYSRRIFARVVCRTPQLYIRWPLLAERYMELIWEPPETDASIMWFPLERDQLFDEIKEQEKLARNDGVKLPPKQIFRQINKRI